MISDTLSDARYEIERYLRDMPEVYATMRPEIVALCARMWRVQMTLDHPNGEPPITAYPGPEVLLEVDDQVDL